MSGAMTLVRGVLLGLCAATAASAESALKPGEGREMVEVACGICHTTGYIQMNSPFLTPDAWKAEVTKMRTAFGAPLDDETAGVIVDYLRKSYAAP